MKDQHKTKEQLTNEIRGLRESLCQCSANLQARNQDLEDIARYVISELKSPLGMIVGFSEFLQDELNTLSEDDVHYCIRTINRSGRKMSEMINALLLLANSRRLFDNVWYSAYLATMDETSLPKWVNQQPAEIVEAYRFTCLPATSAPLLIRIWRAEAEEAALGAVAKLGTGQVYAEENSSEPALQEALWTPGEKAWHRLLTIVEASEFWAEDSSLDQLGWMRMVGSGGEEWVFEGWRRGDSRIRTVWNPDEENAGAAYRLGRTFVNSLPDWFALKIAQLWTADSWAEIYPRLKGVLKPAAPE